MEHIILVGLVGFAASLVDGALGMGFGPTSSSLLLASGLSPVTTSATVNLAKVATGIAAAISHWRFGNIDRRLVLRLAAPGALGAVIGAAILTAVDGDRLRPILAGLLLAVGVRILFRFSRALPDSNGADGRAARDAAMNSRAVELAGATGGVTNGLVGAWGPVVTPFLLQRGVDPRRAVGSVNTAEVAVAIVSVGSIAGSIGGTGFDLPVVIAMLLGGMLAAPVGAYVIRFLPARILGLAVSGVLLITQVRELSRTVDLPVDTTAFYVLIVAALAWALWRPRLTLASAAARHRRRQPVL